MTKDVDGNGEDHSQEMGIRDWEREESEKKRPSFDDLESTEKKKKKRVKDLADEEMPMLPERRTAKTRTSCPFRAGSQRLLRETRDAAFRPAPIVQKPISSVLEKIRRRKLEVSKKTCFVVDDHDDNSSNYMVELGFENVANEGGNDGAVEVESEEAISNHGISDTLTSDEIQNVVNVSSHENLSPKIAVDEEPKQVFRAPINDTQDLFSDSQTSNSKDELAEEAPNNPLEEVLALSLFALNLKLDSAPLDDISSDEEDNDKENIDPYLHESVDLSPTPNGDPVKPFVDEEAEEEDDSDNDLLRFQDDGNEEDEDSEDLEELRDVIATGYEEKRSDIERRMELHQKLLDQQDAAKTEQLSWKWGPKHRETALLDEEGLEEDDEDEEDFLETTEDLPLVNLRMHIKKIKEMIPQMFTDKDDMYISSDDEEAEKKLVEQCLSEKANQQAELLPPTEDARSKELYGYIKKVNNMPDTRRKSKTSFIFHRSGVKLFHTIISQAWIMHLTFFCI
ncbi:glutamic acid-rich protein-like isoform X2 [Durio zibethinus]|uniref:Glutamic acid-rich protein-like isoform X2 n=1 Tax=Durio zibethinus TaxID=66656 RepID=A0A6P6AVL7_DURZI|nr:glutamic acid-rich protein-like isoform X2 [Durio zibethinus]